MIAATNANQEPKTKYERVDNYGWCDNIGKEVHMRRDDEPVSDGRLTCLMALATILGLSLACWALLWLIVVLARSMIGYLRPFLTG